jgi:hypothetical protein
LIFGGLHISYRQEGSLAMKKPQRVTAPVIDSKVIALGESRKQLIIGGVRPEEITELMMANAAAKGLRMSPDDLLKFMRGSNAETRKILNLAPVKV